IAPLKPGMILSSKKKTEEEIDSKTEEDEYLLLLEMYNEDVKRLFDLQKQFEKNIFTPNTPHHHGRFKV
ncbi:MAG TPA: hypothetical protein O0X31_01955, partial [Methanocorpusculum sp.]|nr:hypothetical protein [Methanocorpusculum sp.]